MRLLVSALCLALAGASPPVEAAVAAAEAPELAGLEAFASGFLEAELRERRVPGAVLAVVRGERVFARGFGQADLERGLPVDPERTLFRVASISKLFTATAALQLVEQGALGLDDDVNRHLRAFRVPDAFGEPVRVRHLLTHTAGFDDRLVGMATARESEREPLQEHLARRLPARVFPPGRFVSYSNYGMALLGAVIEEAAGQPFESYVEERILAPLAMSRSSFAPGPALRADLAKGYEPRGDGHRPLAFDWLQVAPAGQLVSTGHDMARFVRAQLGRGALDGARILRAETLAQMHRRQFSHDPALPGIGFGFMERWHGRWRSLEHAGDWGGFASLLFLLPEADFGFFLSYNVDDLQLRERFVQALLERYFPVARTLPEPPADAAERVPRTLGWYRWNRVSRDQLTKLLAFPLEVEATGASGIRLRVPGDFVEPIELREAEPWRFASEERDEQALFRAEPGGRAHLLFLAAFGMPFAFERLDGWREPPRQLAALAAGSALALSALVGWPLASRRRRRAGREAPPPLARLATAIGLVACAGWLALGVGLAALLVSLPAGALLREPPRALSLALAPGVVAALATFPFLGFVLLAGARGWWSLRFRIHFACVALGAGALLAVLHDWNLVGFHY